jgi:hypothetical protein
MNHLKSAGLVLLGLILAAALWAFAGPARVPTTAASPQIAYGDPGWARAPLWDDGRAEFSTYIGTTRRYGEDRPTTARLILVKEDLLRSSLVKSDAGPIPGRTVEVLKQVFVADFPTGTYSYHQVAMLYFGRATLEFLKEVMSHSESCGITFVRIGPEGGRLVHHSHSYWDGEADRQVPIVWPSGKPRVHWDALPVWLRSLPRSASGNEAIEVLLLPTQISGHSPLDRARPTAATVRLAGTAETVRVPQGEVASFRYVVESAAGRDTFWLAAATPHTLVRMATAAGRRLELARTQRLDYWNHHAVGDERLIR